MPRSPAPRATRPTLPAKGETGTAKAAPVRPSAPPPVRTGPVEPARNDEVITPRDAATDAGRPVQLVPWAGSPIVEKMPTMAPEPPRPSLDVSASGGAAPEPAPERPAAAGVSIQPPSAPASLAPALPSGATKEAVQVLIRDAAERATERPAAALLPATMRAPETRRPAALPVVTPSGADVMRKGAARKGGDVIVAVLIAVGAVVMLIVAWRFLRRNADG